VESQLLKHPGQVYLQQVYSSFFFLTFEEASILTKEHDCASDAFARAARVRRLPHRTVDAGAACSGAQHT